MTIMSYIKDYIHKMKLTSIIPGFKNLIFQFLQGCCKSLFDVQITDYEGHYMMCRNPKRKMSQQ